MGDLNRAFGRRLRELRESALLTQAQLGERAGMSDRYVGAVERGERNVTLFNVERIRKALGIEARVLFTFEPGTFASEEKVDEKILANLLSRCDKPTRTHILKLVKQIVKLSKNRKR